MVSATKLLVAAQPESNGAARQNAARAMDFAAGVKVDLLLVDSARTFRAAPALSGSSGKPAAPAHAFPGHTHRNLTLMLFKILMGTERRPPQITF